MAKAPSPRPPDLPPGLALAAGCGLTVPRAAGPRTPPPPAPAPLILSPDGRATLARHGFDAPPAAPRVIRRAMRRASS